LFWKALAIFVAFACGAVTAAVFLWRPMPMLENMSPQDAAAASLLQQPAPRPERPPRVIPVDRSPAGTAQTTGTDTSGLAQGSANSSASAASSCNQAACTQAYHSFDSASCTYQPSKGPRRRCNK
jgi:hypothetical protein